MPWAWTGGTGAGRGTDAWTSARPAGFAAGWAGTGESGRVGMVMGADRPASAARLATGLGAAGRGAVGPLGTAPLGAASPVAGGGACTAGFGAGAAGFGGAA